MTIFYFILGLCLILFIFGIISKKYTSCINIMLMLLFLHSFFIDKSRGLGTFFLLLPISISFYFYLKQRRAVYFFIEDKEFNSYIIKKIFFRKNEELYLLENLDCNFKIEVSRDLFESQFIKNML